MYRMDRIGFGRIICSAYMIRTDVWVVKGGIATEGTEGAWGVCLCIGGLSALEHERMRLLLNENSLLCVGKSVAECRGMAASRRLPAKMCRCPLLACR